MEWEREVALYLSVLSEDQRQPFLAEILSVLSEDQRQQTHAEILRVVSGASGCLPTVEMGQPITAEELLAELNAIWVEEESQWNRRKQ